MDQNDQIFLSGLIVHQAKDLANEIKGFEFSIREVEIVDEEALKAFLARRRLASTLWRPIEDPKGPPPEKKR